MMRSSACVLLMISLANATTVNADDDFDWLLKGTGTTAQPEAEEAPSAIHEVEPLAPFGTADTWRWAIYTGAAHDFDSSENYNLHFSAEYFIATDFSVNLELGVFYFDQIQNTWGTNFNTLFRWHFLKGDNWTIYGDAGAGLLWTADDVPDQGTSFDFTPQAGLGATIAVGDGGARLMTGLRWHHISNARTQGEQKNPGRDSLMGYVGISFPWGN